VTIPLTMSENVAFAGAQINLTPGREAELARRSLAYQAMRPVIAGSDP